MANRKILYGYQIIHGDLVIQEEERLTVQNVFTTYLAGLSYQTLADRMNADNNSMITGSFGSWLSGSP